jgi:micrococcal nuclease
MIKQKFVYEAKVLSVHDGDTISVEIDLGFELKFTDKIRFFGLNAPELKMRNDKNKLVENPTGTKTLDIVKEFLPIGSIIVVETIKDKKEKYGRYLANIYAMRDGEQVNVNKFLLEYELAVPMKY